MERKQQLTIFTIGHSIHPIERFLDLLEMNGITAVADVRSSPFSHHNPQFNKDKLPKDLKQRDIAYVFVGKELGARSDDSSCYTSIFKAGIERVLSGARKYRVALLCAEKEPLDCHRTLLVSRALEQRGVSILHILPDGSTEPQPRTMCRLLDLAGLPQVDMFCSHDQLIERACEMREEKIAHVDESFTSEQRP